MHRKNTFLSLYANENDEVMEHPTLGMLGRSGTDWLEPVAGEMIPLPKGASLVSVPGRIPVASNNGRVTILSEQRRGRPVQAVAALLPQGFTRTLCPACVTHDQTVHLPLLGYAAIGFRDGKIWVAAVQSDEHRKWHPCYFNTIGLPARINRLCKKFPDNRIIRQLANCSLQYGCFTAQNIFYGRWEAGIPTMTACNADCLGCISESHLDVNSPQTRLDFKPSAEEISELGIEHLQYAQEGMISFGQGCEGEPSLNAAILSQAVMIIRQQCSRGTININTNAGYTNGIQQLCEAGLDAMRVTIFSCQTENYGRYHRPRNYELGDVEHSIQLAKDKGVYVSVNLLAFPGFTDREDEIEALLDFLVRNRVDMVQMRNLNIDPDYLFNHIPVGGEVLGINNLIQILQTELPELKLGSYSHPVPESDRTPTI